MIGGHTTAATAKLPHEKDHHRHQIEATDGEIDRLVYELYGLTAVEVRTAMKQGPSEQSSNSQRAA